MFGSCKKHVGTIYEPSKKHVRTIYGTCNHHVSNHKGFVVMTLSGQGYMDHIYGPYKNHIWTM